VERRFLSEPVTCGSGRPGTPVGVLG